MRLLLAILIAAVGLTANGQEYSKDLAEIRKAIEAHDSAVHVFDDWQRDPFITIGPDGYYYLTITQHGDSVDGRKIIVDGAPLYKSKDLAEWEYMGYPYTIRDAKNYDEYVKRREERNKDKNNRWGPDVVKLWAPEIHYINKKWHLLHTSNAGIGNMVQTKGKKLEGPFIGWNEKFGRQHDPTIYQDDDGSCWLVSRCTQIQKLNKDLTAFDGEPIQIGPANRKMGHEGAVIIKFEGKYVLFGTAWSRDTLRKGTYNLYYCTSDNLTGPYGDRKFAGRFLGHGTPFKDKEGRWWCTAFFNANKPTLTREEAQTIDTRNTAYTLNKQGLTLVPLEIKMVNGDVEVTAKDPDYRYPGAEEVQQF